MLSRERRSRFHAVLPLTQAGGRCEMEPMPFGWTGGFRVYLGKRFGWKKESLPLSIAQFLVLKREKTAKSQSPFRAFKIKLLLKYSGQFNVKNYRVYSGFFFFFFRKCHVQRKYFFLSKTSLLSVKIFSPCRALQHPKILSINKNRGRIFLEHC